MAEWKLFRLNYKFASGQDAGSCDAYASGVEDAVENGKHWESKEYSTHLVSVELIPEDKLGRALRKKAVTQSEDGRRHNGRALADTGH